MSFLQDSVHKPKYTFQCTCKQTQACPVIIELNFKGSQLPHFDLNRR